MGYAHELGDNSFIVLNFVENPGMAFGMEWGGLTGKYILSVFRILAVAGIGYFIYKQTKKPSTHPGFMFAMALIFAGAAGNIIDSAFYGWMFDKGSTWDPVLEQWVHYHDTASLNFEGYAGFLQGTVVDMFQFKMVWPEWVPWVGGQDVFSAIWNFADFCISIGVLIIILRQKTFFKRTKSENDDSLKVAEDKTNDSDLPNIDEAPISVSE
jgi:signal peptidase II